MFLAADEAHFHFEAEYWGVPGKEGCWKRAYVDLLSATGQWGEAQAQCQGPLEDTPALDETLLSSDS